MVRWLAIGLVFASVSATGATQVTSAVPKSAQGPIYLVRAEPLVGDISVSVILGWDNVNVHVDKGSSNVEVVGGHLPRGAIDLAVQTWVLKADGTALPRWPGPGDLPPGVAIGEPPAVARPSTASTDWSLIWGYRYAQPAELSAVVVRIGGVFHVRPIPQTPRSETQDKPTVAAFFSLTSRDPAFWVECRNAFARGISWADVGWMNAYRIDGILAAPGAIGGSWAGDHVAPGDKWQGILDLRQSKERPVRSGTAPIIGTYHRRSVQHPLAPGRHTIAVRCFDRWSDDFVFLWEPARSN